MSNTPLLTGVTTYQAISMFFPFLYFLVTFCHCCSQKPHEDNADQQADPPHRLETSTFFSKLSQTFTLFNQGELAEQTTLEKSSEHAMIIPFEFPLLPSYGVTTVKKIAKIMGCEDQRVQSVLVRIIYRLLQFHVKRLFGLISYEFAVPRGNRYTEVKWSLNPDAWFSSLMAAFFPYATMSWVDFEMQTCITQVHLQQFNSIQKGDFVEFLPVRKDGSVQVATERLIHRRNPLKMVLYTLPKPLWNVTLPPNYTVMTGIMFYGDIFCMEDVVKALTYGLEFAFDMSGKEPDVLITAANNMPSLEASKAIFHRLSRTPIPTISLPIPHNLESLLDNFQVPRLFCYHPIAFAALPEQYGRVLGQIILGRTVDAWQQFELTATWQNITTHLQKGLKPFLPDCSIQLSKSTTQCRRQIGDWDPESGTYFIYKECISKHQTYSLILTVGKPVNLNLKQLNETSGKVYPQTLVIPTILSKDILIARMFHSLWTRVRGTHSPEIQSSDRPKLPTQKSAKKKKRNRVKKSLADLSRVDAALRTVLNATSKVVVKFMRDLESEHFHFLTKLAFFVNSIVNDYSDLASTISKAMEFVQPASGEFRYTLLTLRAPFAPQIIAQQMIPLPVGTIFAFLSNGQILRTSIPIIFINYPYGNFFIWIDMQEARKNDLNDNEQTFATFILE